MRLPAVFTIFSLLPPSAAQAYALTGDGAQQPISQDASFGSGTANNILGNAYNYWAVLPNGTFDLTRANAAPTTSPILVPFMGDRASGLIEPTRTVLCIIDMQNFFLHPSLSPAATAGRAAVPATAALIKAFRNLGGGVRVAWVNWGLTDYDLLTIPPAFKSQFSVDDKANMTFGSDMGTVDENGTTIAVGRKLWRGSWNAEPYGELEALKNEGLASGTDALFHKNRLSGLWGPQTPFGQWLLEQGITTIFFGGVNADQCVWSTFVDAYFKGYDVAYVDDIAATTSPAFANEMTRYNANGYGFVSNSSAIIDAFGHSV